MTKTTTDPLHKQPVEHPLLSAMVTGEDASAYMAFITEKYPLLREALDRVAEELINEGVDLQRLREGDFSVLSRSPTDEGHNDMSGT